MVILFVSMFRPWHSRFCHPFPLLPSFNLDRLPLVHGGRFLGFFQVLKIWSWCSIYTCINVYFDCWKALDVSSFTKTPELLTPTPILLYKAYPHRGRIEPMHCCHWGHSHLNFNLSSKSFRNQKNGFCGPIHAKFVARDESNSFLVWLGLHPLGEQASHPIPHLFLFADFLPLQGQPLDPTRNPQRGVNYCKRLLTREKRAPRASTGQPISVKLSRRICAPITRRVWALHKMSLRFGSQWPCEKQERAKREDNFVGYFSCWVLKTQM